MNPRIILSLPADLDAKLRAAASARGEAVAVWIREAIREKLDRDQ